MKINICGRRYRNINGNWARMYNLVIEALYELGAEEINLSNYMSIENLDTRVNKGITDSEDHYYIYNHTYLEDITSNNFYTGKGVLFLKPTGPSPEYFTLDSLGYAASSSITYEKPFFENVDSTSFFSKDVPNILKSRQSKWSDREDLRFKDSIEYNIPKDHILLIGQMPGDETVTKFSFGNNWFKFVDIVNYLIPKYKKKLVIKLHPTLKREAGKNGGWEYYKRFAEEWRKQGVLVLEDFESLYDVLPKTKLAILENSTAGIDCLIHQVPVISYGLPEYHWVTKDMRHLNMLSNYIEDMSWYNQDLSNKWVAWYCTEYQCKDLNSTVKRLKEVL